MEYGSPVTLKTLADRLGPVDPAGAVKKRPAVGNTGALRITCGGGIAGPAQAPAIMRSPAGEDSSSVSDTANLRSRSVANCLDRTA
eukprot:848002-Lingulodinium_polyedra.AAC.1